MHWIKLNSLRNRYAILTLIFGSLLLSFSSYQQNKVRILKSKIEQNIEYRKELLHRNYEINKSILITRDLLFNFQINPQQFKDSHAISDSVSFTLRQLKLFALHPWVVENHLSTIATLSSTLKGFNKITKKLIQVRLSPELLFPSLKIANLDMQPLAAEVTQNLQLAIKEIEDNYSEELREEYQLLINFRFNWSRMISHFRMYLLNQLNAFESKSRNDQLDNVHKIHDVLRAKLDIFNQLNNKNKLSFATTLAFEKFYSAALKWIVGFNEVKESSNSEHWRNDTFIYENEIEPKLEKISVLLRYLHYDIEKFGEEDLISLFKASQLQVNSIWIVSISSLFILLLGLFSLIKTVLNPIATITKALEDESLGVRTDIKHDLSVSETKNLISAFKNMRNQIHTRQEELEFYALHDSLTGLGNRDLFNNRLEQTLQNAKQERKTFSVLIMDLDRFKEVNDTLGHAVGDKLLQSIAKRLLVVLRDVDLVVRLGGDEFAVLLESTHEIQAKIISEKILDEFNSVFNIDDTPLYLGISIGIAVYPQHGTTSQVLQQHADIAMYVAKRNKMGHETYDPAYDEYSIERLSLISDLRTAIDNDELYMEYQPVIDVQTGKTICAEALLRWEHPQRGKIYPDEIIPIAEQTGLINPITYWVADTTAKFNNKLLTMGVNIKIAINLSVYNLQDKDFISNITNIYLKNNISPDKFIMEVTESVMMTNPQQSISILNDLDRLGIEISIDDFGTGYSSLAYLKKLPISKLKIDKSFIIDMLKDDNDAMIVRSTIDLSRNLGMEVVAEGIETKEILELLDVLGCHLGQGYYISHPIPEEKFKAWILDNNKIFENG
ncbi:MAG: EAL domain-containing protein [Woeseiaceae bacterium]